MTRTFKRHKETKGTWQYREIETDGAVMSGAIYLKKAAIVADIPPAEITVTIEEV